MPIELLDWLRSLPADAPDGARASWDDGFPFHENDLDRVESALGVRFPDDYRGLVLDSDRGALTGPNEALNLEPVGELADLNSEHRYVEAIPDLVVVAASTGGLIYAYDPRNRLHAGAWALYWLDLTELRPDAARLAGRTLTEALRRIADGVAYFDEPKISVV